MLFPGQFPRSNMRPPRRTPGNFLLPNRQSNQPPRRALGNFLFSNRQTNQLPFNSTPFTSQSQNTITSIASKGIGGFSKTLDNVQQVLRVIESATPIVQQYGPMVKNLPAMYRMMKAFKDINSEESGDESLNKEETSVNFDEFEDSPDEEHTTDKEDSEDRTHRSQSGQSIPKLFI